MRKPTEKKGYETSCKHNYRFFVESEIGQQKE